MKDIAQRLWNVRREMVNARFAKQLATTDLATREAELQLAAEGKNAEERKARAVILMREDAEYQEIRGRLRDASGDLEHLEAEEKFLEDTRRAQEWDVRLKMAAALSGKAIASDGNDRDAQEALDDAQVDQAFSSPTRPVAGSSQWRLPRDPQPWQMPQAELPASLPPPRNAPVAVSLDDEVPF